MKIGKILKRTPPPGTPNKLKLPGAKSLPPEPKGLAPRLDWETLSNIFLFQWGNDPQRQIDDKRTQGHFHPSAGLHPDNSELCHRNVVFDLMCAKRSAQSIPSNLVKILDNGKNRHLGLQELFHNMAKARFMGMVDFEAEVLGADDDYSIYGRCDGIATMETGHRYVFDFKTIGSKPLAALRETKDQHKWQVNTYLGMLHLKTGFVLYENKDNQSWAKPNDQFYHDFDPKMYAATKDYCREMLSHLKNKTIPEFEEDRCSKMFCGYQAVCDRHLNGKLTFDQIDQRNPEQRKRHLRVV